MRSHIRRCLPRAARSDARTALRRLQRDPSSPASRRFARSPRCEGGRGRRRARGPVRRTRPGRRRSRSHPARSASDAWRRGPDLAAPGRRSRALRRTTGNTSRSGASPSTCAFSTRIGSADGVTPPELSLSVIGEDGSVGTIGPGPLALLRYPHLSLSERVAVARVARRLGNARHRDDVDRSASSFASSVSRRLRSTVSGTSSSGPRSTCEATRRAPRSASSPCRPRSSARRDASDLVLPAAPLGEMHGEAAGEALRAAGATVRTGVRVASLGGGAVVLADGRGSRATSSSWLCPRSESARLLEEPEPPLDESPIVSVHLLFDRAILGPPLAALLGSPAPGCSTGEAA